MCGIAGSYNTSMFEVLMEANSTRGDFASGIVQLKKKTGHETYKREGLVDFNKDLILDPLKKYYIGHAQAPTSGQRSWQYDTSHPFFSLDWCIMHNGVLTNDEFIRKEQLSWDENPVDTSLIVNLLQEYTSKTSTLKVDEQRKVIKKVLEQLEGTFGLVMVYLPTNAMYLARQGSVLHIDKKGNFSSVKGKTFRLIPEGSIYKIGRSSWERVGGFKTNSPFLFEDHE
jgi:glucosamine 6-phosphate synthetase-like amidotransferase/phosphosugar isomerase protein